MIQHLLYHNPDNASRFLSHYRQTFPLERENTDDKIWSTIDARINSIVGGFVAIQPKPQSRFHQGKPFA